MQCAVIEFARNVCGMDKASSQELDPDVRGEHSVVYKLRELEGVEALGGTMRLGRYPCTLADDSLARRAYGKAEISERHRHRYEVNNEFLELLKKHGLRVSGVCPEGGYVEIVEVPDHPWFLACQFHPEFKSKPLAPHPLFLDFIRASAAFRKGQSGAGGGES
jgi:CTP synthase